MEREATEQREAREQREATDLEDWINFGQVGDELSVGEGLDGQALLAALREHLPASRVDSPRRVARGGAYPG